MVPPPEERRLLPIIDEDEVLLGYQSCSSSDVNSLVLPIDVMGDEGRGLSARNHWHVTLRIAMTLLVISAAIIMTSTPFTQSSSIHDPVNRKPSVYDPSQVGNLLGFAKPDQKNNKKGGKVVVVQVVKIKFPQQTPPYGYYYPPPPGGSYYNGPLLPPPQPTPPVATSEKPKDQDWKT